MPRVSTGAVNCRQGRFRRCGIRLLPMLPKSATLTREVRTERRAKGRPDIMTTLELTLNLPEQLAQEAQAAGLLTAEELERMGREALGNRRTQQLEQAREVLAANPIPPMTPEEIQAEIDAYRAQMRRATGS